MQQSRRQMLGAAAALAAFGLAAIASDPLKAQEAKMTGDSYPADHGAIVIHPVQHASFVMAVPDMVIYSDPVGGAALYAGLPRPDLILITHEHPDHFDPATLAELVGSDTRLVTSQSVHGKLPADLKARATALTNGASTRVGTVSIDAIPAYNTTADRMNYHPKGRDNGYVLGIDGKRVYIAGDTEDIPEMRALKEIDIAFIPMNLPYTMTVEQAAAGVAAFAPAYVYPYHYKGSDPKAFAALLSKSGVRTKVVLGNWYS